MLFSRRFVTVAILMVYSLVLAVGPARARAAGPSFDAFLGYSRLGSNAFYPNTGGLNGWEAALQIKMRRFLGGEGDFSHYGLGANSSVPRTTTVLFGPRLTVGAAGVHLFVHALLGGEHSANSSTSTPISGGALAVAFGGGADFRIAPYFAWRVAADYLKAPTQSPDGGSHERVSTGLVFRF